MTTTQLAGSATADYLIEPSSLRLFDKQLVWRPEEERWAVVSQAGEEAFSTDLDDYNDEPLGEPVTELAIGLHMDEVGQRHQVATVLVNAAMAADLICEGSLDPTELVRSTPLQDSHGERYLMIEGIELAGRRVTLCIGSTAGLSFGLLDQDDMFVYTMDGLSEV